MARRGHNLRKHGGAYLPEYRIWSGIMDRCNNPNRREYPFYGGKGVIVCERWRKFENFYADMGTRPSLLHTVDRINSNGNYEPDNCRWATRKEQARNTRRNRFIELDGRLITLAEAAEIRGIKYAALYSRIKRGADAKKALR